MAALAMLMVGLLPSVHVHQHDSDTVIHRHMIVDAAEHHGEDASHDETNLDHDGHLTARILPLTYDAGAPFSLRYSPALTVALTSRAVVISLLLAAFFGYVIPIIDLKLNNTYLGSQHFAPGAVITLMVLVALNPLLTKCNRRLRLARDEQHAIYLSCLFSCLVAGIGGNNYWPTYIVGAFYYATPENKWLEQLQHLPWWMSPALDQTGHYRADLVNDFFSGNGHHFFRNISRQNPTALPGKPDGILAGAAIEFEDGPVFWQKRSCQPPDCLALPPPGSGFRKLPVVIRCDSIERSR